MNIYAKINAFGVVENVEVIEAKDLQKRSDASSYVETWVDANGNAAMRYNYAVVGSSFKPDANAFISLKPYDSWVLDAKFQWVAPVAKPADGRSYFWDEAKTAWVDQSKGEPV